MKKDEDEAADEDGDEERKERTLISAAEEGRERLRPPRFFSL